jgi:anti-anti-sigma regulatory factor
VYLLQEEGHQFIIKGVSRSFRGTIALLALLQVITKKLEASRLVQLPRLNVENVWV